MIKEKIEIIPKQKNGITNQSSLKPEEIDLF
jgi:hypothetical protein